jgi:DNA mismatch repair protein MutS
LRRGPCLKSFGIEVARLSGLPQSVLDRALIILQSLEDTKTANAHGPQIDLFAATNSSSREEHELIKKILGTDINRLTPLQALNKLASWQLALRKEEQGREPCQGIFALG